MSILIRNIWPALVLGVVIAMPGAAIAHSIVSTAGTMPTVDVTLSRSEAIQQQDLWRVPTAVLRYENTGTSTTLSRTPTSVIMPAQPSSMAKTYALVLSSIGIVSLISLLRLTRSLSMRTAS